MDISNGIGKKNQYSLNACLISDHWCSPPDFMSPQRLNMTLAEWKEKFLPEEIGPDYLPRRSQCSMFKVGCDLDP